ncbi:MAG: HipA N-terminal domain-containing protein, partial [Nitrospinae bacterium]|nr:HipA N-terminal domain-containing protein [Nitrospinota bacterium]
MQPKKEAKVYVSGVFAGILTQDDQGYTFAYCAEYRETPDAQAVSLTLPLKEGAYHSIKLFPFFEGLLLEGWLKELSTKTLHIDEN